MRRYTTYDFADTNYLLRVLLSTCVTVELIQTFYARKTSDDLTVYDCILCVYQSDTYAEEDDLYRSLLLNMCNGSFR